MRIWSLHPKYLDKKGLGGVWCETLLAKAVLEGKTKGYQHHPQLNRFRESSDPVQYISSYLGIVYAESKSRGLNYNPEKIGPYGDLKPLTVTKGQLEYEWNWLLSKLKARTPEWYSQIPKPDLPDTHPIFTVVEGGIASWEVVQTTKAPVKKNSKKKSNSNETNKKLIAEEEALESGNANRKKSSNGKKMELKTEPSDAKLVVAKEETPEPRNAKRKTPSSGKDSKPKAESSDVKNKQYTSGNRGDPEVNTGRVKGKKNKSNNHEDSGVKSEPVDIKKTRSSSSSRRNPELKPEAADTKSKGSSSNNGVKTVAKQATATDSERKSVRDRGGKKRPHTSSPPAKSKEAAVIKRKKL